MRSVVVVADALKAAVVVKRFVCPGLLSGACEVSSLLWLRRGIVAHVSDDLLDSSFSSACQFVTLCGTGNLLREDE